MSVSTTVERALGVILPGNTVPKELPIPQGEIPINPRDMQSATAYAMFREQISDEDIARRVIITGLIAGVAALVTAWFRFTDLWLLWQLAGLFGTFVCMRMEEIRCCNMVRFGNEGCIIERAMPDSWATFYDKLDLHFSRSFTKVEWFCFASYLIWVGMGIWAPKTGVLGG